LQLVLPLLASASLPAGDYGGCDCSHYEEFGIRCIAPRYA